MSTPAEPAKILSTSSPLVNVLKQKRRFELYKLVLKNLDKRRFLELLTSRSQRHVELILSLTPEQLELLCSIFHKINVNPKYPIVCDFSTLSLEESFYSLDNLNLIFA